MTDKELLETYFKNRHILQSPEWGQFKTLMGTKAITVSGAQLTVHKLPLGIGAIGYAPKIRPADLDLEKTYAKGKKENLIFVKLDVPHAPANYKLQATSYKLTKGRPVFAQSTLLLDLTKSDDELLGNMHEKTRYNLRLSQKKGVQVKIYSNLSEKGTPEALDNFIKLQKETARRQRFFIHPDHYYRSCFELLAAHQMAFLLAAEIPPTHNSELTTQNSAAASWMLFRDGDTLYYPYGESDYELRSYMPGNLLMWEAIQLGKKLGCKVFDLWGAADDPDDKNDPWHGFTRFKMSFGATHVKLAQTYDLVIEKNLYHFFNFINDLRWKILRSVR